MAYDDDFGDYASTEGGSIGSSQTNYGLAQNPLMPMGDPIAYARMMQNPTGNVPAMANTLMPIEMSAGIHTPGVQPPQMARLAPLNVPDMGGGRGGGGSPTGQQQPTEQEPTTSGPNLNSLSGLLQMKGMSDLMAPSAVSAPGAGLVPAPGAGAGPGRAPTGAVIGKAAAPYQDMINDAAKQNGVDPQTLTRLLYRESQFDPKAKSPAGAQGLGQFMPATAREEGVDVNDPKSSIYGSAKYLAKMTKMFNGNEQLGMAAYNWGPGNLHNWLKGGADLSKLPAETRDYVNAISGRPLAPNTNSANVPSAAAAPMAALVAAQGGGFAVPGQDQRGQQVAPAETASVSPLVEQFNRPPVVRGGQQGVSPAVQETDRGQPPVQWPPERGVYVPGATPPTEGKPTQNQPQQQQPSDQSQALQGFGQDPRLQKLWQYMLLKSLIPEIKFRNIGYDPWAVHRFGQGGGY